VSRLRSACCSLKTKLGKTNSRKDASRIEETGPIKAAVLR